MADQGGEGNQTDERVELPAVNSGVFTLTVEDLNGDCFIVGAEGETEVETSTNIVYFPHNWPADNRMENGLTNAMCLDLLKLNYMQSTQAGRIPEVAAKVAFVRMLASKQVHMHPDFTTALKHVKYNHARRLTAEAQAALVRQYPADFDAILNRELPADIKTKLRKHYSDYVCCVAYIFRVRGHHYKVDYLDRYKTLWNRCLHAESDLPLPWEFLATDALHAITPIDLDNFWHECVETSKCAGTLIKRFDSAPAGCAGVSALNRGLQDVLMLFPGVIDRVPESYAAFTALKDRVLNSRWGGSVNNRYYGTHRIRVDENAIGALASVVMGVYEYLAEGSKLRDSPALKRLAEIAPATGGALGVAAFRATKDERLSMLAATNANSENVG